MRFLMLNWRDPMNPISGGAERVSKAYLGALAEKGHQVWWFANDFPGAKKEEESGGIHYVRGGGKGSSIWQAFKWHRRQEPFDLIIDQHHGIPWYAPWWSRTSTVAYIHEVLGPIWNSFYEWPMNEIGQDQEKWTHWLYRNIPFWTPSESTKRVLLTNGVREVNVFPNGTDTEALADLDEKPFATPLRLICVSRLAPNKRVDQAIEALLILHNRGTPSHLTIVGTGDVEAKLKKQVQDASLVPHVTFAGQLDEAAKNAALKKAHLLIHTSIREGWGLNVIEANAMGTPAIVYPVGGLVDSTVHDMTGLITLTETPQAIANGVAELLKKPSHYQALRINAWERAKTFAWPKVLPPVCDWLVAQAHRRK